MKSKVVLLLGAGASVAMGYPLGDELRKEILFDAINRHREHICGGPRCIDVGEINNLVQELEEVPDAIDRCLFGTTSRITRRSAKGP